ncbi:YHS domain-containing protein [Caldinitratiruptor microaerophilus]|uniref:TRASH domain-containing protein n=1 Tax=Caldinitratiruptor microaerophilus TaxID=671077 RepID=A0AA35CNY3_9FIRM|nr:YHS domain-containing protein [Caldinitratiruptor microaerophilus]BDG61137.1 hypothetical protein caldi_22270 [Caldinitratiruptor microaerophilus]
MLRCPVCHNPVDPGTAPALEYKGQVYFFKCHHCLERFTRNPEAYLSGAVADADGGCARHGRHGCH